MSGSIAAIEADDAPWMKALAESLAMRRDIAVLSGAPTSWMTRLVESWCIGRRLRPHGAALASRPPGVHAPLRGVDVLVAILDGPAEAATLRALAEGRKLDGRDLPDACVIVALAASGRGDFDVETMAIPDLLGRIEGEGA